MNNFVKENKIRAGDTGSYFVFFTAALLPLLLFIFSLAVDFSIYLREDQKLQEIADQAAILGWRYLPYQNKAKNAVHKFLSTKGLDRSSFLAGLAEARPESGKYNDEFEVEISRDFPLQFISYFLPELSLKSKAVSRSRATPADIFIVFDRSFYMAANNHKQPLRYTNFSGYLRDFVVSDPFIDTESGLLIGPSDIINFKTQLCFNPFYSEIKKTVIRIYEYFAAVGRNGVGVAAFPGIAAEHLRVIRPLLSARQNVIPEIEGSGEAIALQTSIGQSDQDYYLYNSARITASSWCAGAAANELDADLRTPNIYDNLAESDFSKLWIAANIDPREIVANNNKLVNYNQDYLPALSVKEVVWSAVVKNQSANIDTVLNMTFANLLSGAGNQAVSLRAGLSGSSIKTAIILSGDVPYYNGIRFENSADYVTKHLKASLENIRQFLAVQPDLRLKIIYAILNDQNRNYQPPELRQRSERLEQVFTDILNTSQDYKRLHIEFLYTENSVEFAEKILALSLLDNIRRVISY